MLRSKPMTSKFNRLASRAVLFIIAVCGLAPLLHAQDNYEIQVYGSETVAPRTTMVELHSNYTIDGSHPLRGSQRNAEGLFATNHAEHETVEITQGLNDWSELGFYIFTSYRDGQGYNWVGDHIRPRVRVPPSWNWPVGVSLSTEVGYERASFAADNWSLELRPIVDKQIGHNYIAFNPALEYAINGPDQPQGFTFSPAIKYGYDFNKRVQAGFEYYGSTGPVFTPSTLHDQQQQLFLVSDLNVSPDWEINFGLGVGVTANTDHLIAKFILGRRFSWPSARHRNPVPPIETH